MRVPPGTRLAAAGSRARSESRLSNLTNGRSTPEGKGLLGALRYYGFDTTDYEA